MIVSVGKKDDGADQKKRIFTRHKRQRIVVGSPTPFVLHGAYVLARIFHALTLYTLHYYYETSKI